MLKKPVITVLYFLSTILISCNTKISDESPLITNYNLAEDIGFENQENLKPTELKITQLDETNPESFFKNARILDVVGDTILLLEDDFIPTRIIMFDTQNGTYLGQIKHQGEGPGEYRFIHAAFVDALQQSVIIPDIDRPYMYNYSLKNDSLLNIYDRPDVSLRLQPIGNINTGISIGESLETGLKILQFDSEFEKTDSIFIEGFQGSLLTTIWSQSGLNGILLASDTLFVIERGQLNPEAFLNMGNHKLTEKDARETMAKMTMSADSDDNLFKLLSNYIIIRDLQFTKNHILITYIFDEKKQSDLYETHTGKILNRFECEIFNEPNKLILELEDGNTLTVGRLFTKDDVWYGIADEGETARIMNTDPANSQVMIVSFKI